MNISGKITKTLIGGAICGALIIGTLAVTTSAMAHMRTLNRAEISHLTRVRETGFVELYQHPDLESFAFTHIYFEPVTNRMQPQDIYDIDRRPRHIEELAEDFHEHLLHSFKNSGLLTSQPDERTLVISTAITDVGEFHEQTTGSHLARAPSSHLLRGGAVMEMVWRAGPEGEVVLALRDGRTPERYAPVTDRDDDFTDTRDAFEDWAVNLVDFFAEDFRAIED